MDQTTRMTEFHALLKSTHEKIEKLALDTKKDNSKKIAKLINDVYHSEYSKDAKYLESFLDACTDDKINNKDSCMYYLSVLNTSALLNQLGVTNKYRYRTVIQDKVRKIEIQQVKQEKDDNSSESSDIDQLFSKLVKAKNKIKAKPVIVHHPSSESEEEKEIVKFKPKYVKKTEVFRKPAIDVGVLSNIFKNNHEEMEECVQIVFGTSTN